MAKEETAEALAAGVDIGEFSVGVSVCVLHRAALFCYFPQKFIPMVWCVLFMIGICDFSTEFQRIFLVWKNFPQK